MDNTSNHLTGRFNLYDQIEGKNVCSINLTGFESWSSDVRSEYSANRQAQSAI